MSGKLVGAAKYVGAISATCLAIGGGAWIARAATGSSDPAPTDAPAAVVVATSSATPSDTPTPIAPAAATDTPAPVATDTPAAPAPAPTTPAYVAPAPTYTPPVVKEQPVATSQPAPADTSVIVAKPLVTTDERGNPLPPPATAHAYPPGYTDGLDASLQTPSPSAS